jgi:membrane protein required for colicin V production
MTLFDMMVLGLVVLSGFEGYRKGGVRELIGVTGFTLSLLIAVYALPFVAPVFRKIIKPDWAGAAAGLVGLFVAAHMALNFAAGWVSGKINKSAFGGFDRMIGLGFGLVRSFVILGLFALVFNFLAPEPVRPGWVTQAVSYPLAQGCARIEAALAPKGMALRDGLTQTVSEKIRSGLFATDPTQSDRIVNSPRAVDRSPPTADGSERLHRRSRQDGRHQDRGGSSPADRRALDALVEQSR